MIKRKSRIELFLSRKVKLKSALYGLLAAIVFALTCIAMTLDYNDQMEIAAAKACTNEVFAFDNPKLCEGK